MQLSPLVARALFPDMAAHATLTADEKMGGGSFELVGRGMMSLLMRTSDEPGVFDVEVEDIRIDVEETGIDMAGMAIRFPRFTVTRCDLDLAQTRGSWHRQRSQLRLQVAIRLDPLHFPFMRELGYHEAVTLVVTESGTMEWQERRVLETHAEPIRLPPPLDFLTVSPDQFDRCEVAAELWVAIDCDLARELRATEVWICPGDRACLAWQTSNASSISLDPGGAAPASGTRFVSPTATTTYVLEAKDNKCSVKQQVTVRVVRPGETTYTLTASWSAFSSCMWRVEIPEALVGKSVMVQQMQHVRCAGGTLTWPEWGYKHTSPSGAVTMGNVKLDVWSDIPDQPLAGVWEFTPVGVANCRPPEGYSGWESACFQAQLGCR